MKLKRCDHCQYTVEESILTPDWHEEHNIVKGGKIFVRHKCGLCVAECAEIVKRYEKEFPIADVNDVASHPRR